MPETHWAVSLAISIIPLILFLTIVWWHARQIKKCLMTRDGRSIADVLDELKIEISRDKSLRP